MKKIEKTIFISYRRTNIYTARAIFQNLTQHGYDVFFDYESIDAGDFSQQILESIESRAHFLLILTPSALERCQNPGDWLRREIEHAIKFKRNIVPLTFEGFDFEEMQTHLPDHIADPLSKYNGLRVPADYFPEAMVKLRTRYLNVPLDTILHPKSDSTERMEDTQKKSAQEAQPVTEDELSAEEYFERGLKNRRNNRLDEAVRDYTEALRLKPDDADAWYNRGYAYNEKGEYDSAIADYTEALRLKPDDAMAYINRGVAYEKKGEYDRAIADYTEALRLQPDDATACYNRGVAYYHKGEYDSAIADYNEALHLKPDYAMAYNNRGYAYYLKGEYEKAIADYEKALAINPNDELARKNLKLAKRKLNN